MVQIFIGLLLVVAGWAALRGLVDATLLGAPGPHRLFALALDLFAPLYGFALFTMGTARPILAGLVIVSLAIGLAVADRVKRAVLDEPVVFADRAELLEVVRHPRLYISFVGVVPMVAGTIACVALVVGLFWLEPPIWHATSLGQCALAVGALVLGRAGFVVPTAPSLLRRLADCYAKLEPSREPIEDAARFGLLASCIMYATLARAERPGRQRGIQARSFAPLRAGAGPILLIQGESFVDIRRLHPTLAERLPHYARLAEEAALAGRLAVPCWGANTIRTELAAVAGIDTAALGLDRFNPYEAFAHVPLPSLAHQARAAGYRTICVHPYSRTFYARDKVMPLLGFDRFIGIDGFDDAPRDGGYVTDVAVAHKVAELVATEGPDIFVFVVTMENHGPWDGVHDIALPAPIPDDWSGHPDARPAGRWLRHIAATDAMIPILRGVLEQTGRGWLGFYGDHQPSLTGPFHAPGAPDRRTDYVLWGVGADPGPREDLAAHDIADRWLDLIARG